MTSDRRSKGRLEECSPEEERAAAAQAPGKPRRKRKGSRAARLGKMQNRLESLMSRAHEQRRSQRVQTRQQVNVTFAGWETFRLAWTINISRGGMLVQLTEPPEKGQRMDLNFCLPNGTRVSVLAEVRHFEEAGRSKNRPGRDEAAPADPRYQVGLEFVAVGDDDRVAFDDAMAELERQLRDSEKKPGQ